jgi:hypothetical protein
MCSFQKSTDKNLNASKMLVGVQVFGDDPAEKVIAGVYVAEERRACTTIGGQVNLVSRLKGLCEPGCVLINMQESYPAPERGSARHKRFYGKRIWGKQPLSPEKSPLTGAFKIYIDINYNHYIFTKL